MRFTSAWLWIAAASYSVLGLLAPGSYASEPTTTPAERAITRVFIQDPEKLTLMWADLLAQEPLTFSPAKPVEGFPQLDPERQSLVQMAVSAGKIMVGVRDDEDGEFQCGWVLVDTGVEEEEHGDHSHWYYNSAPKVIASRLDQSQGNLAHLYCYDGVFYLANDHAKDIEAPNVVTVIHLDPNRDGSFADAKIASEITVGASEVEGHGGHHDMVFDASGRMGVIANPGDRVIDVKVAIYSCEVVVDRRSRPDSPLSNARKINVG